MMLSVVELPPNVPQPNVIEQSSPVVIPQQPCAPGDRAIHRAHDGSRYGVAHQPREGLGCHRHVTRLPPLRP